MRIVVTELHDDKKIFEDVMYAVNDGRYYDSIQELVEKNEFQYYALQELIDKNELQYSTLKIIRDLLSNSNMFTGIVPMIDKVLDL
jgi:hypothetical protein